MNGSCPPDPVPTSHRCQTSWVNTGMEKRHFLYKPHLFYICHTRQPQKEHFLASRKPAQAINRMCLTCSPTTFLRDVCFPLVDFNTIFVSSFKKTPDWLKSRFQPCFLFLREVYRCSCTALAAVTLCSGFFVTLDFVFFFTALFFLSCKKKFIQLPKLSNDFITTRLYNERCVLASVN